ncbi:MAG: family 10 glycosylhydrolase [Nitrososphaerota archaeon]
MQNLKPAKFFVILLLSILIIGTASSFSTLNSVLIKNSGRIVVLKDALFESEIRGMFVRYASISSGVNLTLIAKTCAEYGINTLVVEAGYSAGTACYYSDYHLVNRYGDQLTLAIQAARRYGLKIFVLCANMPGLKPNEDPFHQQMLMVDDNGSPSGTWACPSNPIFKEHAYNITKELVTKFDIDGYMFDFIRYPEDHTGWCYCDYCKARFQEWLGENVTDWASFKRGGSRQLEYLEWRTIPITEIVQNVSATLRALKPNIVIGAAVWTYFGHAPSYWRKYLGQDTGRWIKEGYLDFVSPMIYTENVNDFEGMLLDDLEYMVGGPEGKIPIVPFIDITRKNTPETFAAEIEILRKHGVDGWILFAYGGPGDGTGAPDARDFLSMISMPPTFKLGNIQLADLGTDHATITWITTLPATSIVEYSTTPLFNATWEIWYDFHYWKINYVQGTVVQNSANTTYHSITIINLSPNTKYYFRVQSKGSSGTLTSEVLTFTTTR